jgi:hypothetical protein
MKMLLIFLAALAAGPPSTNPAEAERLMAAIEEQVRLPQDAAPLEHYARHYAFQTDGKVVGVYLHRVAAAPRGDDWGCEEIILEGNEIGSKPIPCPPEPDTLQQVSGGERRWFDDPAKLPYISDGGCGMITVIFNPATNRVEHADCNGVA